MLNQVLETSLEPEYQPERKGDVRHSSASVEKAQNMLGFVPAVTLEEGLRQTVKWYADQSNDTYGEPDNVLQMKRCK